MIWVVTFETPDGTGTIQREFESLDEAKEELRKLQSTKQIGHDGVCIFIGRKERCYFCNTPGTC